MAKFESRKADQVVSFGDGKLATFKDGVFITTKKEEIALLKKCKNVIEVKKANEVQQIETA